MTKKKLIFCTFFCFFISYAFARDNPTPQTQNSAPQTQKTPVTLTEKYESRRLKFDGDMLRKFFSFVFNSWREPQIGGRASFAHYPIRGWISADNRTGTSYPEVVAYKVTLNYPNGANEESVSYDTVLFVVYAMSYERFDQAETMGNTFGFALDGLRYFYLKFCAVEYLKMADKAEMKNEKDKAAEYRAKAENAKNMADNFQDEFEGGNLIYSKYESTKVGISNTTGWQLSFALDECLERVYGPKIRETDKRYKSALVPQCEKQKVPFDAFKALSASYRLKNGGVPFSVIVGGKRANFLINWWAEPDTKERDKYSKAAVKEPAKKWNYLFLGAEVQDGKKDTQKYCREHQDLKTGKKSVFCGQVVVGGVWEEPFIEEFQSKIILVGAPIAYPIEAETVVLLIRRNGTSLAIFIKVNGNAFKTEKRELAAEETATILKASGGAKFLISEKAEKILQNQDEQSPFYVQTQPN